MGYSGLTAANPPAVMNSSSNCASLRSRAAAAEARRAVAAPFLRIVQGHFGHGLLLQGSSMAARNDSTCAHRPAWISATLPGRG